MNKIKQLKEAIRGFIAANLAKGVAVVALVVTSASAHAQEADVAGIVTDASSLLTSIYPIVIGAVAFGILVSLVKMVRRK